jgi:hypothetical protein
VKQAEEAIGQMKDRLEKFKGDKSEFEERIAIFERLLAHYKEIIVDCLTMDHDMAKFKLWRDRQLFQLAERDKELDSREQFIDDWGGKLTDEQLEQLSKMI